MEDSPTPTEADRLPGWVWRALLLWGAVQASLFYLQGVVSSLRPFFIILLVSLFLSFALEPLVNRLERMGLRRGAGTGIVFVATILAVVGFGAAVGTALAEQITSLVDDAPETLDAIEMWVQDNVDPDFNARDLEEQFAPGGALNEQLTNLSGNLIDLGTTIVSVLFQAFTVALFTFYMVAEGPRLRRAVCSVLPPRRQREVLRAWDLAVAKTGGYIVSRAILATASFLAHWLAFRIIGVPSPLAMALWVGVISQFIPVVGTYLAGIVPLIITVADEPINALWVLVFIIAYQQLENYVFAPRITAQTMEIHVAVAFGAVLVGGYVLGPVGALLALPAAATAQAFLSTYLSYYDVVDELGNDVADHPSLS